MLRPRAIPTRSIRLGLRHASTITSTTPPKNIDPHSVYIRFTPSFIPPNNTTFLPTTLTLIRTLERLFGSISDFTFSAQDKQFTGNSLLVRFHDEESVKRVFSSGLVVSSNEAQDVKTETKEQGKKFQKTQVTLKLNFSPPVLPDSNRPGGIGLDDLNALGVLRKADYDPTFSTEGSGAGQEVTLSVEDKEWPFETFINPPSPSIPKYLSPRANHAFIRWHGFGPKDSMSEAMRTAVDIKVARIRKRDQNFVSPLDVPEKVKEVQVEVEVEPMSKVGDTPAPEPELASTTLAPEPESTTVEASPQLESVAGSSTAKPKVQVQEPEKEEIDPALGKAQIKAASQLLESIRTQRDAEQAKKILAGFEKEERKREHAKKQRKERPLLEQEGSAGLEFAEMSEAKGKEETREIKEEGKEGRMKKFLGGWF